MQRIEFSKVNMVYPSARFHKNEIRRFRGFVVNKHILFLNAPLRISEELRSPIHLEQKLGEKVLGKLLKNGSIDIHNWIFYPEKINEKICSEISHDFSLRALQKRDLTSIKYTLIGRLAPKFSIYFLPKYEDFQPIVESQVKSLFSGDLNSWNKFLSKTNGMKIDLSGSIFEQADLQKHFLDRLVLLVQYFIT